MAFFKKYKIRRLEKKLKSLQDQRKHDQPSVEALKKEKALCYKLAKIYLTLFGKKKFPFAREMAMECYRAAASIEDADAQYFLAQHCLDEAKLREGLQERGPYASASNIRLMNALYEEAHAYLQAAEALKHAHAKRLRGLCFIYGWGVSPDKDRGFELVVQSIEQENAWEKIPQIFAEIGLNKPEFFAAIMKRRQQ